MHQGSRVRLTAGADVASSAGLKQLGVHLGFPASMDIASLCHGAMVSSAYLTWGLAMLEQARKVRQLIYPERARCVSLQYQLPNAVG